MQLNRQDAWSPEQDQILAEVVLHHISDGSTQLKAFEEVGIQLSRTAAACGFRWNAFVRKQYKQEIAKAKEQRKKGENTSTTELSTGELEQRTTGSKTYTHSYDEINIDDLNEWIKTLIEKASVSERVIEENGKKESYIRGLEKELKKLKKENTLLSNKFTNIESDYKSIIEIMERARRIVR